jgi:hypothetical protein
MKGGHKPRSLFGCDQVRLCVEVFGLRLVLADNCLAVVVTAVGAHFVRHGVAGAVGALNESRRIQLPKRWNVFCTFLPLKVFLLGLCEMWYYVHDNYNVYTK